MARFRHVLTALTLGVVALTLGPGSWAAPFKEARIYIEFNASANDLGYHVSLDAEDWKTLKIVNPAGVTIFEVEGKAAYKDLGMTELFFEGAEPSLDDFPLENLLALFPEGSYRFIGVTVDGSRLTSRPTLSHAVPEGPAVHADVDDDAVTIGWEAVTEGPEGFPERAIHIVGYQVIVGSFQVTLPASSTEVTLPEEFVESLGRGTHAFEVLAIDVTGNQSITEGTFEVDD
jgi:hypothetical protein